MRKILVLRGGALGDFIVTLPALGWLRQRWPDAQIELAGNPTAAALGCARGVLDAVHSQHEARWSALYGVGTLPLEFRAWLESFDLVLNYWPDPDRELRRHFPARSDQVFLSAAAMPTCAPAAAHYFELIRPLAPEAAAPAPIFPLHPLQASAGSGGEPGTLPFVPARGSIAIHPGSGSSQKNWPLDRWADLCAGLQREHSAELLIVSGEAEGNAAHGLARFGVAARNLPLEDLILCFSRCRLFLGHDSGISHLAAACGVPSILLFGPTDCAMWAPPSRTVRVLGRSQQVAAITLADVQSAVAAALRDQG